MKTVILLIFLVFSSFVLADETLWPIMQDDLESFHNKKVRITGIVKGADRHLRARDTFYTFKLKDPKSNDFIQVKLFTVLKFKKVNDFYNCKNNHTALLKGKFRASKKDNRLGEMLLKNKDAISCEPPKPVVDGEK